MYVFVIESVLAQVSDIRHRQASYRGNCLYSSMEDFEIIDPILTVFKFELCVSVFRRR
jgi:hypothetical protein